MSASRGHSSGSVGLWVRANFTPPSPARSLTVVCLQSSLVQLLHKLSIRGVNGPEKLLKVIKVRVGHATALPLLLV